MASSSLSNVAYDLILIHLLLQVQQVVDVDVVVLYEDVEEDEEDVKLQQREKGIINTQSTCSTSTHTHISQSIPTFCSSIYALTIYSIPTHCIQTYQTLSNMIKRMNLVIVENDLYMKDAIPFVDEEELDDQWNDAY